MSGRLSSPTENALLEALRKAVQSQESGDGLTGSELARQLGWGRDRMYETLRRLMERGVIEVCRLTRQRLDGIYTRLNGYRLKEKGGRQGGTKR